MMTAKAMAETYEANRPICKYVHSTSRGHEAIQLATAFQLKPCDYVSPYYRDESIMLGMGWRPYEMMLQLLAKGEDPFTGGREYYNHPNSRREHLPKMIHQSSATGMQAVPTTGVAQGFQYIEAMCAAKEGSFTLSDNFKQNTHEKPVVVCCFGDGSITEGEVSEAFQFAALKQLPIIYLVPALKVLNACKWMAPILKRVILAWKMPFIMCVNIVNRFWCMPKCPCWDIIPVGCAKNGTAPTRI
jgi:2-oxoisovalerate dehydrogenase E1 component